jgi:1-acyl-sn-glycerol-3-phosphate acyltransferase
VVRAESRRRERPRRIGFWYRLAEVILRPLMMLFTKRDWRGVEHLPDTGGFVAVTNHVSHVDPLVCAHYLFDNGCLPRFLGKEVLFRLFFVGQVLRGAKQIPVYRESADASMAYRAAVGAVRAGECVVIYPEATLTRDPGLWPMVGKTGAARVALETGAPVIPIAQWGPQTLLPPYAKRPHLVPRTTMHVWAGPPVDLSEFRGRPIDAPLLRAATERIMADVTALLEQIRGEQAPDVRFDLRGTELPRTGNPKHPRRSA